MKNIHAIAHTHWDFEWYFTRQEAQVQFAFHMDEVFSALASHQLDYYLLDGQLSIVDDYLSNFPEKTREFKKYVQAKRLFIGLGIPRLMKWSPAGKPWSAICA
ncbi:alpha-mannosidase [Agrilactobacillus composti DSM 18527 = JCM 14202]|nr:alpha-mannosidase [Agrilactobacillus composti DSM 18527 = JCM 14202]